MALINYPLAGAPARAGWITSPNVFDNVADAFKEFPHTTVGIASTGPSSGNPWWFIMDFQTAMTLTCAIWVGYSNSYTVPSDVNLYGSATGAFAGEETLLGTITGMSYIGSDYYQPHRYPVDTPQSFRYLKFEIIKFGGAFSTAPSYFAGLLFEFADGELVYDTTTDYIEPTNKIVSTDWCFLRRKMYDIYQEDAYTDRMYSKFWTAVTAFVEDFGWDVQVVNYPVTFLASSKGVDDDQPENFTLMSVDGSYIGPVAVYGYWDPVTKTGSLQLPHTGSNYTQYERMIYDYGATDSGYVACGNKDMIILACYENRVDNYYGAFAAIGRLPKDPVFRPAQTTLVGATAAGALVNIEVGSSAGFEVGSYYCMWGIEGEGRDFGIRCTAIPDTTHVTVDILPRNYSAGSFIGNFPNTNFFYSGSMYHFGQRSVSGLLTTSAYFSGIEVAESYIDPAGVLNKHILFPHIWYEQNGENLGVIGLDPNISGSMSGQAAFDVHLIGADQPGTATSGGVKTLTDTTKAWTVNEHAGRIVFISAGTGYHGCGNYVEIVSNTADTLTVAYDWLRDIGAGATYYITDELWQVLTPQFTKTGACKIK